MQGVGAWQTVQLRFFTLPTVCRGLDPPSIIGRVVGSKYAKTSDFTVQIPEITKEHINNVFPCCF